MSNIRQNLGLYATLLGAIALVLLAAGVNMRAQLIWAAGVILLLIAVIVGLVGAALANDRPTHGDILSSDPQATGVRGPRRGSQDDEMR